jgi:hypothetical protein
VPITKVDVAAPHANSAEEEQLNFPPLFFASLTGKNSTLSAATILKRGPRDRRRPSSTAVRAARWVNWGH